jgi:hypothetical protein
MALGIPIGHVLSRYAAAHARFDQIQPGMTYHEVRTILGPPGFFDFDTHRGGCSCWWSDGSDEITVHLLVDDHENLTVLDKHLIDEIDLSGLGWVRRWLR